MPFSFNLSSLGGPSSATSPSERTKIRSQSRMVFSLWAMVKVVAPRKHLRTAVWIAESVAASTAAVASSRTTSFDLRSTARAMETICRCPADRFWPLSLISNANSFCRSFELSSTAVRSLIHGASCASSSAAQMSGMLCCWNGSQLYWRLSWKRTGSCGIIATAERRSFKPSSARSSPSRFSTEPGSGSMIRSRASSKEDLPAPVRPTTPSRSPAAVQKLTPFRTNGKPAR
mmetsp:Transcript_84314/g.152130  ORF Transcript_84314/g.152130 Transcript_84314/m.152130 type:complete len:231 (-) Transcript_84314:834-1526(-)